MTSIDDRLSRLEDAILQVAAIQDPAMLAFPRQGNDARTLAMNDAERQLAAIAAAIRHER